MNKIFKTDLDRHSYVYLLMAVLSVVFIVISAFVRTSLTFNLISAALLAVVPVTSEVIDFNYSTVSDYMLSLPISPVAYVSGKYITVAVMLLPAYLIRITVDMVITMFTADYGTAFDSLLATSAMFALVLMISGITLYLAHTDYFDPMFLMVAIGLLVVLLWCIICDVDDTVTATFKNTVSIMLCIPSVPVYLLCLYGSVKSAK